MKSTFALIDCNNFFVSCERAFQPNLEHRPVAVLSNNDGCVIARSAEVKKMGIRMGMPYFECREKLQKNNVAVFSSNFSLYGDMSQRVMQTLSTFTDEIEIYSIDEAFLELANGTGNVDLARDIRSTVQRWTRIPVSVGIAPTKVLAKVANHIAKKNPEHDGVFDISQVDKEKYLADFPVGELWGIGRQSAMKLWKLKITTAGQLMQHSDDWLRKNLSIHAVRIVQELRGAPCFKLDDNPEPKKGITCSRSFGRPVNTLAELTEAVALYTERAAEKLREQHEVASYIYVFIRTNMFNLDKKYIASRGVALPVATASTHLLINETTKLTKALFKEGYRYFKAGVSCIGLIPENIVQQNLFSTTDEQKNKRLMRSLDVINHRFGNDTLHFLGSGLKRPWNMKKNFVSQRFTTSFTELPVVK